MRILMVNKFLYPNGGSETYMFTLGEHLQESGHEVQYFGMESDNRVVGNRIGAYTANMDFHGSSKLKKVLYPIKTIYSAEARRKIRQVLDDFKPDVCHLNNFNYQLTPSIILEIVNGGSRPGTSAELCIRRMIISSSVPIICVITRIRMKTVKSVLAAVLCIAPKAGVSMAACCAALWAWRKLRSGSR